MFVAIVSKRPDNRVGKFAVFDTRDQAEAHVALHGGFVVENPPGGWRSWRVNGRQVQDDPEPEPVPSHVTKYQFRIALQRSGRLAAVRAAIADAGIDEEIKIYWSDSDRIARDGPLIAALKSAMSLTDTQIDNFFRTASEVQP